MLSWKEAIEDISEMVEEPAKASLCWTDQRWHKSAEGEQQKARNHCRVTGSVHHGLCWNVLKSKGSLSLTLMRPNPLATGSGLGADSDAFQVQKSFPTPIRVLRCLDRDS